MTASILPVNLADLERDLDAALSRIEQVEIPIAVLWNPWECPLDVLPYLAWAVSVDQWRSDWPEVVKRRVVAGSLGLHRIKGTRPAVVQALQALGVEVELVEWFEATPTEQPGTFSLIAWANENITPGQAGILNDVLYSQLLEAVNNAKNTRSHYSFKVGAKFGPNALAVGGSLGGLLSLSRRDAVVEQAPLECVATLAVVPVLDSVVVARRTGELFLDAAPRSAPVLMGAACGGVSFVRVSMEVKV